MQDLSIDLTEFDPRAFIKKMGVELGPYIFERSVPIYASKDGHIFSTGTGTLIKIANMAFLVTAGHVIDKAEKDKYILYISNGKKLLELYSTENCVSRHPIPWDIALWKLPDDLTIQLNNKIFVKLSEIELNNKIITPGFFWMLGFPLIDTKINCTSEKTVIISGRPFYYGGTLYNGEINDSSYKPLIHILIQSSKSDVIDENDNPSDYPASLEGISGCSIWQSHRIGESYDNWKPESIRLVAVQTMVYGNGDIIRGTYWHYVAKTIWDKYHKLRDYIKLH